MHYTEFLRQMHELVDPVQYLEIGVRDGKSLKLARNRAIAVDPAFRITHEVRCEVSLHRCTSDAFFEDSDTASLLSAGVDLAFIDGMHLAEFAFRDFMNTSRYLNPGAPAILDDVVPSSMPITSRDQLPGAWTGDVYKVALLLISLGHDVRVVDTKPSGLALIMDAANASAKLERDSEDIQGRLIGDEFLVKGLDDLRSKLDVRHPNEVLRALIERRSVG